MIYLSDVQVAERYGVTRVTPWRWANKARNGFPHPVKLSPGTTRWRVSDLEKWEAERVAATGDAA